ncbi:MAG: pantetheine-phosphate adenylyltransferase [Lachnospiraceae bacterium]|nr:pantetheine-phosphate adenylyltransferase [Lachnospiraceae bacterium]
MSKAVFPGSFDPVTVGHMDLIRRAARMFDELVVAVLINVSKNPLGTLEERVELLEELVREMPGVSVQPFEGLLVDFVQKTGATAVVRGLRTAVDFEYELPLAQTNYHLYTQADTVFLATAPEYSYISSSGVKEILAFHGDIRGMVPESVYQWLQTK